MGQLDAKSHLSLYYQLKSAIIEKILKKEWEVDKKIPTEFELCERYGVSRITVRKALSELEDEGYLVRRRGKGTYISVPKIEQNLMSFYSFSQEFEKRGFKSRNKILEFSLQVPEKFVQDKLKLEEGNKLVYYFKRLRYADDIIIAIEATYLPAEVFPDLERKFLEEKSLYNVFRENYGIIPVSAQESFGVDRITEEDNIYFDLEEGAPVLDVARLTYDKDKCIEYTQAIIRGDNFRFCVNLDNSL